MSCSYLMDVIWGKTVIVYIKCFNIWTLLLGLFSFFYLRLSIRKWNASTGTAQLGLLFWKPSNQHCLYATRTSAQDYRTVAAVLQRDFHRDLLHNQDSARKSPDPFKLPMVTVGVASMIRQKIFSKMLNSGSQTASIVFDVTLALS